VCFSFNYGVAAKCVAHGADDICSYAFLSEARSGESRSSVVFATGACAASEAYDAHHQV
jgi:hypothetical protein